MTTWQQQITPIKSKPSSISGLPNGKFPDSALSPISGSVPGRMCHEAARCWNAMAAAAKTNGVALSTEGSLGSYRDYAGQQKMWDLYQSGHGNVAAKPGTSNHGFGLANDVLDADRPGPVLSWLEAHAAIFGWQWETQESWHIHYMNGDAIPQAVLDYENEDDMAFKQELWELQFGSKSTHPDNNSIWLVGPASVMHVMPPALSELQRKWGTLIVQNNSVAWDHTKASAAKVVG